jgi:hypothetical protein
MVTRRQALQVLSAGALAACHERPAAPQSQPNSRPALIDAVRRLDGEGARVHRLFPLTPGQHLDPFVLLDDFRVAPPAGFPEHPHRGFEAFTYMLDGSFHHRDNLGHDSIVASGGTQRFTSGRGARHSEMPAEARDNRGLQLWVNLPRALKTMDPDYAAVHGRDLPERARGDVVVRTVVGEGSPVQLRTAVRYLDLTLKRASHFEDETPADWRALAYVVSGRVRIGEREIGGGQAALLVAGAFEIRALGDARLVYLAGRPHREPILQRGPFVD